MLHRYKVLKSQQPPLSLKHTIAEKTEMVEKARPPTATTSFGTWWRGVRIEYVFPVRFRVQGLGLRARQTTVLTEVCIEVGSQGAVTVPRVLEPHRKTQVYSQQLSEAAICTRRYTLITALT